MMLHAANMAIVLNDSVRGRASVSLLLLPNKSHTFILSLQFCSPDNGLIDVCFSIFGTVTEGQMILLLCKLPCYLIPVKAMA